MLTFPADFKESDGRWRDLIPGDFVPVLYETVDGSALCAACINAHLDDEDRPWWEPVTYSLLYEGPPESCDACSCDIETLYGDPADPGPP